MKTKFLKLPVYQQGLFLTLIWLMVGIGVMLYRWPTSDQDFQTTAYWLAPNLIHMQGEVTAQWFPFSCAVTAGVSLYVVKHIKSRNCDTREGLYVLQNLWPIWLVTIVVFFLLNLWLPQTGMTRFSSFDRQVLTIAILFLDITLFSSYMLWLNFWVPVGRVHNVIKVLFWAVLFLGAGFIMSHFQFTFASSSFSLDDLGRRTWLTLPFWPSWFLGLLLTAVIWWHTFRRLRMTDDSH
jgi:hypothetical protein